MSVGLLPGTVLLVCNPQCSLHCLDLNSDLFIIELLDVLMS